MDPLSKLPYELLSLIIDYTADWITLESLIQISPPLHDLFTTPAAPSTSPKKQTRRSARTSSKAHREAIRIVKCTLENNPIMSVAIRRHFHIITKLRQFSSQPAVRRTICYTTLLIGDDDSSLSFDSPPAHTTLLEMITLAANIQRLACACLSTLLTRLRSVHPHRWTKEDLDPKTSASTETYMETYKLHDVGPPSWLEEHRIYRPLWLLQLRYELLSVGKKLRLFTDDRLQRMKDDYMDIDTDNEEEFKWLGINLREIRTVVGWLEGLDEDLDLFKTDAGTDTDFDLQPRAQRRPSTRALGKIRKLHQKATQTPLPLPPNLCFKPWSPSRSTEWLDPSRYSMIGFVEEQLTRENNNNSSSSKSMSTSPRGSQQDLLQSWYALGMAIWDCWRMYGLGLTLVRRECFSEQAESEWGDELPIGPRPARRQKVLECRLSDFLEGWNENNSTSSREGERKRKRGDYE
ncbi:uncharacterized protein AKAW2_11382S [Aspergillus luchuensis]|uniref:Uncharacterized protein n=1 Tax=Aspergillus kawachii TaxID=1069201 RepID=A0A146F1X4_ASPKA|nr:uncharacterized protein AKAW2_11382S [Aspergillus luchuensis]BCR94336.1 hypothetical protein AKAW2_11382S [Aspergillus luchuensis]BCS06941.1 hypothetical protein ALUC_11322S [Aspergillus luchuensis]GAA85511.1 hypothetical protein AKAW_03625 [Aspergillus luchuensis IFO 4308]GAT20187.1 hypothetical protein RIB2604_00607780 [Aspergillus luchuensis]